MEGIKISKPSENITKIKTEAEEFSIIWVSDAHLDSTKSKTNWLHGILKKYPKSYIVFGGDSIDGMQGRNDKRGSKSTVKPQLQEADYWNQVINYVKDNFYERYKDRIVAWNRGNHDNSIIRNLEVDLLSQIVDNENLLGDFSGYIQISVNDQAGRYRNYVIYYQHAPSSGGKRSKGMLSTDIIRGQYPDADCYITEHIHTAWMHPERRETYNKKTSTISYSTQWFIQNTTIKDEFEGKRNHYYHEKIKAGPQCLGVVKMDFRIKKGKSRKIIMKPEIILYDE